MKRVGAHIVLIIGIFGLPSDINLASCEFYLANTSFIWIVTAILAVAVSLTQFESIKSPTTSRLFRKIRFYLFKTKNIATIFLVQLLIAFGFLVLQTHLDNLRTILISVSINLIGLNILIISEKLSNSDSTELLLHTPVNGCVYLYAKNKLRYIPDPETFNLLGLSWSDVVDIDKREYDTYEKQPHITSAKSMPLYRFKNNIYGLVNDKLKHVPNEATLNYIRQIGNNSPVQNLSDLDGYVKDKPFASFQAYF